jgi:hypothetical protein
MHKSRFRYGACELASPVHGTFDIRLLGTKGLIEAHDLLEINTSELDSDDRLFSFVVGLDCRFYYLIQEHYKDKTYIYERGVGHLELRDDEYYIVRELPLGWGNVDGESFEAGASPPVPFEGGDHLIALSVQPPNYLEALMAPHSIIASTTPMNPTPVELESESLLGRKDDVIQSIDMDELRDMFLTKPQKQLKVGTRRLELTRKNAAIASPVFRASPVYTDTDKPPAQEGYIIYNKESKRLELFDGEKWVAMVQEDA